MAKELINTKRGI